MSDDLIVRVQRFLDRFEIVFHADWDHTRDCLHSFPSGSFLDPTPGEFFTGDAIGNCSWCNYGGLLNDYRELRAYMISEGLYAPDCIDNP